MMIVSLSPFQVPRRSGIADCGAAAVAAVSAANMTMQPSFDMAFSPCAVSARVVRSEHYRAETQARQGEGSRRVEMSLPENYRSEMRRVGKGAAGAVPAKSHWAKRWALLCSAPLRRLN